MPSSTAGSKPLAAACSAAYPSQVRMLRSMAANAGAEAACIESVVMPGS